MDVDLLSVIIPTYNRSQETIEAVNSVISQNGANEIFDLEIIIVDDCSEMPHFSKIYEAFHSSEVRIIKSERNSGGPAHPRNLGINAAKGKWIAFLDSDDKWDELKIVTQLKTMKQNGTKASGCTAITSTTSLFSPVFSRVFIKHSKLTRKHLYLGNFLTTSSLIIAAEIIELIGKFPVDENNNFYEDYAYWLRVVSHTDVSMVANNLVFYATNGSAARSSNVNNHFVALRNTFSNFDLWVQKDSCRGPNVTERILLKLQLLIAWIKS